MKKISVLLFVIFLCGCAPQRPEITETRLMMDTVCTIRADEASASAVSAAFDRIAGIAAATDYYSESSELSAINQAPANSEIKLSSDMTNILAVAIDVSEKSGGAFDITIAPVKDLWNFSGENPIPPADDEIKATQQHVGFGQLILDRERKTLIKTSDKCKIDLGGAAKGYAADCAAEILKESGCKYAIIDLGGNVYVFGENPARPDGKWTVGIQKPFDSSGTYTQIVTLNEGAVVTAGSYQRFFEHEGRLFHHILDPKSGYPSDNGISGASIRADSALLADCLSTACMVLGEEKGRELAEQFNVELITEKQRREE